MSAEAIAAPAPELALGEVKDLAVPPSEISESPTNTRRTYDDAQLAELVESVRGKGVIQAIGIRPNEDGPKPYTLIYGCRRLRAAIAAGLAEIPVKLYTEISDVQAEELQVIENLQRADLEPLEEARAFAQLAKRRRPEDIAARVGKSAGYVRSRLALDKLPELGKQMIQDGALQVRSAFFILRLPDVDSRSKAVKEIAETNAYSMSKPWPHGEIDHHHVTRVVQSRFMLNLKRAPFDVDDATLDAKAGTCTACPKRTDAQVDLFGKLDGEAHCTDAPCFNTKTKEHRLRATENAKVNGQRVLSDKEARALFPSQWDMDRLDERAAKGRVDLDAAVPNDKKGRTYRKLAGPKVLAAIPGGSIELAFDLAGKPHYLVPRSELRGALKAAGLTEREATKATPARSGPTPAEKKARENQEVDRLTHRAAALELHRVIEGGGLHKVANWSWVLRMVIGQAWGESVQKVADRHGLQQVKAKSGEIPGKAARRVILADAAKKEVSTTWAYIAEILAERTEGYSDDVKFEHLTKAFGIDTKKLAEGIRKERAAAASATEKPVKASKAKKK